MNDTPLWRWLRARRYALPQQAGGWLPAPDAAAGARIARRLSRRGIAVTLGYFQGDADGADAIVAAYGRIAAAPLPPGSYLSVKAPPLGFCPQRLRRIAEAGAAAGLPVLLDAHAPADADATLAALAALLPDFPDSGIALPARWRRSAADAARLSGTSARIRVVKGEWADPLCDAADGDAAYLRLIDALAGRAAPVAVATHKPALAAAALDRLLAAGTPCELEQLRGLPGRRPLVAARTRGVGTRLYVPLGPGWWPYAIDKALARPHLPLWYLRDRIGLADR